MKKLFLITMLSVILLSSCQTLTEVTKIPKKEELTGIDFTKYTKQGFLFTPEKYTGSYESIGLIDFVYMPEANLKTSYITNDYSFQESKLPTGHRWEIDKANLQDAIDAIHKRCVEMGANALVGFSAVLETNEYLMIKNPITIKGFRITGFAIKIKE